MSDLGVSRVYVQEGFRWDEQRAYLFDIDGTLLRHRDRVHFDAFDASVRSVMGRDLALDGVTLSGNTDPGILRDAFRLAKVEDSGWRPQREDVLKAMCEHVVARRAEMLPVIMPGVEATLAHLNQTRGSTHAFFEVETATTGWTAMANVSGFAAISLPLAETSQGLPIGVQLMAPEETVLLQLAAQLERAGLLLI